MHRTMIVGAGASAPFYDPPLLTTSITAHLTAMRPWEEIINRYNNLPRSDYEIRHEDVIPLILRIIAVNHRMNFEELIELLDKISGYNVAGSFQHHALHDLLRFYNARPTISNTIWTDVPYLARQLIAEYLLSARAGSEYNDLLAAQTEFLKCLVQGADTLSIYSLNYDEPLPQSVEALGIPNGFLPGGLFHPASFFDAPTVTAYPHGHARFCWTADGMRYYQDVKAATRERFDRLNFPSRDETLTTIDHRFAPDFDTFLTTGRTKEHAFDHDPYAAYYQRLAIDLRRSDELYVLGYSFGDPHINRFTRSHLVDPNHRVLIVDLDGERIDLVERYLHHDRPTLGLRALGYDHIAIDTNDRCTYQDEVDQLNDNGYGTLYPRVILDKRGYATFLRDRNPVLGELATVSTTPP